MTKKKDDVINEESELVEKVRQVASEAEQNLEEVFTEVTREVTKFAKKNPLQAVAIGFGVGCVVGILLARR